MSSRFKFALASRDDDPQLRARMAEDRMEGDIAISFRREPSYFAGCRVQGDATAVVKCFDTATGRIAGLGSRSTLTAYVDGQPERIGYLADLRSAPEYRRGTLLARGYRFLRQLHEADPVAFYTTVIYEGNRPAIDNLLGARAGLPTYRDFGRVLTPAIHLDFPRRPIALPGVSIVRGDDSQLADIVAFLNNEQSHKQFAPVYRTADFGGGRFLGLRAQDFFLAIYGDRIVGTMAAWDQSAIRQTHVERYSASLSRLRPFYNLAARLSPLKPLPEIGSRIPYLYLACVATQGNDVQLLHCLLRSAYNKLRRGPWHYAIAGLHESDPLAAVFKKYRNISAAGRLFVVHYESAAECIAGLKARVPAIEAGCL